MADQAEERKSEVEVGDMVAVLALAVAVAVSLGVLVCWIRFQRADLPASAALAAVPKEAFLTIGLRELALPALLSCAVYAVGVHLARQVMRRQQLAALPPLGWPTGRLRWQGVGMAAFFVLAMPPEWRFLWTVGLGFWAIGWLAVRGLRDFRTVWLLVLLSGCGWVVLGELERDPMNLPTATVERRSGPPIAGAYVAATATGVYIGRDGALVLVPPRQLETVEVRPPAGQTLPDSLGQRIWQALPF